MSNTAHEGMDEMIDHLDGNPQILRRSQSHRALPIDASWPARWPFVPQGCDQQGRLTPTIKTAEPAPVIVDRLPEEWDEDQSESADGEVMSVVAVVLLVVGAFWALVKFGGLA